MKKNYYITTAIDYPNANPHIGHAFEKIITDSYARWHKLVGKNVFFLTGLDEHGQKIQQSAKAANLTPEEFVNKKSEIYKNFIKKYLISNDEFIRTTDKKHEDLAQQLFQKVLDKKEIYLGDYEGHYCIPCERFWTETQLNNNLCPDCGREVKIVKEPAYFFKMGKYQERLIKHIENNYKFIVPKSRRNEILSRLKEPLNDLCVSRTSFDWGIKLPNHEEHIIYVWFDALINYLSGIDFPDGKNSSFWPADVHVLGKDVLWFHAVIWPTMLMALDIPLPKTIFAHGFINDSAGEKMSKSKGNVIDPIEIVEKYGTDAVRYYLLRNIPSGSDGNFSEKELITRYNNELANDLGNLVMRITKLVNSIFGGTLKNNNYEKDLIFETKISEANELFEEFEHHQALDKLWSLVAKTNAYINEQSPWKIKDDKQKLGNILYNVLNAVDTLQVLLRPFIPEACDKIAKQINSEARLLTELNFEKEYAVIESEAIFPKIEDFPEEKNLFPLDLRVGKIVSIENHPEADKLYVMELDLGIEKRTIVAGLKPYYKTEDLEGKKVVVVCNLKPAKLRGIESNGMILAADQGELVGVLISEAAIGTRILPDGYDFEETGTIDFKEFSKIKLLTDNKTRVIFKNKLLTGEGKFVIAERVGAAAKIR